MSLLYFQAYDWKENYEGPYSVLISCHTRDSKIAILRIEDYEPYCTIELPSFMNGHAITWTQGALKCYAAWLRAILKDDAPTTISYLIKSKLHYYTDTKYPILTCHFKTSDALKHCINLLK